MAQRKKQSDGNAPNIVFVGGRVNVSAKDVKPGEEGFVPSPPITSISDGMDTIILPDAGKQIDGPFYHREASRIRRLFPHLYKEFRPTSQPEEGTIAENATSDEVEKDAMSDETATKEE